MPTQQQYDDYGTNTELRDKAFFIDVNPSGYYGNLSMRLSFDHTRITQDEHMKLWYQLKNFAETWCLNNWFQEYFCPEGTKFDEEIRFHYPEELGALTSAPIISYRAMTVDEKLEFLKADFIKHVLSTASYIKEPYVISFELDEEKLNEDQADLNRYTIMRERGKQLYMGSIFWDTQYQIRSAMYELLSTGEVVFELGEDITKSRDEEIQKLKAAELETETNALQEEDDIEAPV
jgi:hypothetical protein